MPTPDFTLTPIGVARTRFTEKSEVPRQAKLIGDETARIELHPVSGYEHALLDVSTWSHLWVLFWFDRAEGWRPKVLPPKSDTRRGLFATRAPHRPNPIGMSAVRLHRVEGLVLWVAGLDLLDMTPILDIKPYVPYCDRIPEANSGWLEQPGAAPDLTHELQAAASGADWQLVWEPRAEAQLALLAALGVELRGKLQTLLATGPAPRPYRRIRPSGNYSSIAFGPWRARFSAEPSSEQASQPGQIRIHSLATGYRAAELAEGQAPGGAPAELGPHRALVAAFGYPGH